MSKYKEGKPKTGGRKPGTKGKKTLEKEEALLLYQRKMIDMLTPITEAQQYLAKGVTVVLRKKKVYNNKTKQSERTGEFYQVRDPNEIEALINSDGEGEDFHIISARDPNPKAIKDIFDMVFGKPKEQIEINLKTKEIKKVQDGIRLLVEMAQKRNKMAEEQLKIKKEEPKPEEVKKEDPPTGEKK